jgi:hypothetical protein
MYLYSLIAFLGLLLVGGAALITDGTLRLIHDVRRKHVVPAQGRRVDWRLRFRHRRAGHLRDVCVGGSEKISPGRVRSTQTGNLHKIQEDFPTCGVKLATGLGQVGLTW